MAARSRYLAVVLQVNTAACTTFPGLRFHTDGAVLQYGARFKKEDMERLLRARGGMSKKQCQVLFADEGEVAAMTGFVHNSVTPVGMDCEMPIFLSHHVVSPPPSPSPALL